jgi:hypothetical protein
VAQDHDFELPLAAAAREHANDAAQEAIQQTHQHDGQSEPITSTAAPRNRISLPQGGDGGGGGGWLAGVQPDSVACVEVVPSLTTTRHVGELKPERSMRKRPSEAAVPIGVPSMLIVAFGVAPVPSTRS